MSRHTDDEEDDRDSELAERVERLTDEIHTLRQAVDDLREELAWELRQLRLGSTERKAPFHLTSMPIDPVAPDFHQRVNAVDASVFAAPVQTFEEFVKRLTSESAAVRLAVDDWVEDQDFTPGEVVEVDLAIMDWFAEYLVVVRRESDWFLADDGEGWFYLLWCRNGTWFLRLLTDEQQRETSRLTGIQPEIDADADVSAFSQATTSDQEPVATQRSLW